MHWKTISVQRQCTPEHFQKLFRFRGLHTGTLLAIVPISNMRTLGSNGRPTGRCRTVDEAGMSVPVPEPPLELVGYPGGPSDRSLLVRYEHHVARRLWFREERGLKKELKVAGHGTKLKERIPHLLPPEMEDVVSRSGLTCLRRTSLTKIDINLVSAFMERWHIETSSFHMPFGEMTITLDDVASMGNRVLHCQSAALANWGFVLWLYDKFVEHQVASSWAFVTRAYLMMLVGCTIFSDKTFTLFEARYLFLFRDLHGLSAYSWASAALVTLYRHLGDASIFSCKQLGGYLTLLQCWIHEYFPTLGRKGENWRPSENHGLPRAMRWSYKQGAMKVDELRPILDQLTPIDVVWCSFKDHRRHRPFDELSLYRGFLVWADLHVPYLSDRCLR
ncbi:protein MAIN-LIKE 2-like [Vicia villosa]|uniref:protein MAIN-LIKE 2-like n=1 Tax=Vicia villosa TaxID=3911 RepID=UPI00273CC0A6|nr:protein MAIN-LIKE 2-like [Vicia villosa]